MIDWLIERAVRSTIALAVVALAVYLGILRREPPGPPREIEAIEAILRTPEHASEDDVDRAFATLASAFFYNCKDSWYACNKLSSRLKALPNVRAFFDEDHDKGLAGLDADELALVHQTYSKNELAALSSYAEYRRPESVLHAVKEFIEWKWGSSVFERRMQHVLDPRGDVGWNAVLSGSPLPIGFALVGFNPLDVITGSKTPSGATYWTKQARLDIPTQEARLAEQARHEAEQARLAELAMQQAVQIRQAALTTRWWRVEHVKQASNICSDCSVHLEKVRACQARRAEEARQARQARHEARLRMIQAMQPKQGKQAVQPKQGKQAVQAKQEKPAVPPLPTLDAMDALLETMACPPSSGGGAPSPYSLWPLTDSMSQWCTKYCNRASPQSDASTEFPWPIPVLEVAATQGR